MGDTYTGMADSLTNYIVQRTKSTAPCVVKYMPYGALTEVSSGDASPINDHPLEFSYISIWQVMPYLCRRAIENKSVLGNGGATRERKEAALGIWNIFFGSIGL